jgi:hypothetical protein
MSDDKVYDLILQAVKGVKDDVKSLDNKVDQIKEIQAIDSLVLKEHERRSTASEKRIEDLEEFKKQQDLKAAKLKGFFLLGSLIITGTGAVIYFLANLSDFLKNIGH